MFVLCVVTLKTNLSVLLAIVLHVNPEVMLGVSRSLGDPNNFLLSKYFCVPFFLESDIRRFLSFNKVCLLFLASVIPSRLYLEIGELF